MRVLVITHSFYAPNAEGLVTARTVRALVERGHQVTVICGRPTWAEDAPPEVDTGWLQDVEVHIAAPSSFTSLENWRFRLRDRRKNGWVFRFASDLLDSVCAQHPHFSAWSRATLETAEAVISHGTRPDVVHSRSEPFQSHLAVSWLRKRVGRLPWCAYFSDPWPDVRKLAPYKVRQGWVTRKRHDLWLRRFLSGADSLVFPSARLARLMLSGGDGNLENKTFVIPHMGNSWALQAGRLPERSKDVLLVRHAGIIDGARSTNSFVPGLRLFTARHPEMRGRLRVECIALTSYHCNSPSVLEGNATGLADYLNYVPFRFPDSVIPWLCEADLLLLLEAPVAQGVFMPSKLADYLVAGRPILAISPTDGTVADYLSDSGTVAAANDPEAVCRALELVTDLWRRKELDSTCPSPQVRCRVMPSTVAPLYEDALSQACSNAALCPQK